VRSSQRKTPISQANSTANSPPLNQIQAAEQRTIVIISIIRGNSDNVSRIPAFVASRIPISAALSWRRIVPNEVSSLEVFRYVRDFVGGLEARTTHQLADSGFTLYTTSFPILLNSLSCDACARP
jgi:hypothetical protein